MALVEVEKDGPSSRSAHFAVAPAATVDPARAAAVTVAVHRLREDRARRALTELSERLRVTPERVNGRAGVWQKLGGDWDGLTLLVGDRLVTVAGTNIEPAMLTEIGAGATEASHSTMTTSEPGAGMVEEPAPE